MKNVIYSKRKNIGRRELLTGTALAGLALAMPPVVMAQQALAVTHLRNDIHLISGAGCNVVVAVGPDAVLVVDGGLESASTALLREIDILAGGKPVTTLFNTNWRPHHCGLNYALGPAGAAIVAHENTRLWQNNDFTVAWEKRHYRPMPATSQANDTFYQSGDLRLGDETVAYGFISQGHTDGDIYIHFKESNILVVGDMVTVGTYPILDYVTGGWIGGAQRCTNGLLDMADAGTLFVPAEGAVCGREEVEAQRRMLDTAYEKVADAYRNGRSLDQFKAAAPMADYDSVYGDSGLFVQLLYRGAWYHVTSRAIPGII